MRVLNYYSTKFNEILKSGSIEISAFLLNHAGTIFWLIEHALHLTGSRSFSIHTNSPRKAGSNSITSKYIEKQTFFTHNRLFDC